MEVELCFNVLSQLALSGMVQVVHKRERVLCLRIKEDMQVHQSYSTA